MKKLKCNIEHAPKFREWIKNRGGIAIWPSINLSNPGASWSTPALAEDGKPYSKPTWQAANQPERIITTEDDVLVRTPKEVKRFYVAIRRSSNGLAFKCTDGATRRIRAACAKAGEEAWYEFDYATQEAVIFVPGTETPLNEWSAQ